jgi:hypothetical protein
MFIKCVLVRWLVIYYECKLNNFDNNQLLDINSNEEEQDTLTCSLCNLK